MDLRIIAQLCRDEQFFPILCALVDVVPKVSEERAVETFALRVGLRMIRSRPDMSDVEVFVELF